LNGRIIVKYIKQNKTILNKFHFILFLFLLSGELFSTEKYISGDTVLFSSVDNLVILTQNFDSIKYFPGENKLIYPLSPTLQSFSARVSTYDTASLTINVKDAYKNNIATFIWNSISPGAYKFDWWIYINDLPSGMYYIEKRINNDSETYKAIFVK
jgi:hypothetical protein